jgi:pimeloyl-ACP methyl ester carboxylesterase
MPFAIAADGTRIHYEVTGITKRAPVLLVQGLGGEKNSWNLQRAALALRHRTIAFDTRGAGRSDKPTANTTWKKWLMTQLLCLMPRVLKTHMLLVCLWVAQSARSLR